MRILKNESGQALFLVTMVIMVLLLVGAAAMTSAYNCRLRSFEEKKTVQAAYIAEAGVEKALARIKDDYTWLKGLPCNVSEGYIPELLFNTEEAGEKRFNYAGGLIENVKVTRTSVESNPTTFTIESSSYLPEPDEDFGARRTLKVTGEMYDPIDFSSGVWIRQSTGTTEPDETPEVTVNTTPFPRLEENLYDRYPDMTNNGSLSGNFHVNGIYYTPGDLTIQGTYEGYGMIVTHGNVTINGDLTSPEGDIQSSLAIVAFGKDADGAGINCSNQCTVSALLCTPHKISLANNHEFSGSLVCDQVILNHYASVSYDATVTNTLPGWMTTVVKIKSWKEEFPVF